MAAFSTRRTLDGQHGVALLEALVGALLLSLALLASAYLHTSLRHHASLAGQRTEATRAAQQELERIRALPGQPEAFNALSRHEADVPGLGGGYRLVREVELLSATLKQARVSVRWTDMAGHPQEVAVVSQVGSLLPLYSAVLSMAPAAVPSSGRPFAPVAPGQGAAPVPADAQPLEDGRAVWRPVHGGHFAYLIDPLTGWVTARCQVPASSPSRTLSTNDLRACTTVRAALLQGHVRFAWGATPDPENANASVMPFEAHVALVTATGPSPYCEVQSLKTVRQDIGGLTQTRTVAADAQPGSAARWVDTGERFATYSCLVPMPPDGGWSGRWVLRPRGWSLGRTATSHRVCRYAADRNGNGTIDPGEEHLGAYRDVRGSLVQQNYLVVRGDLPCPRARAAPHNGVPADTFPHSP